MRAARRVLGIAALASSVLSSCDSGTKVAFEADASGTTAATGSTAPTGATGGKEEPPGTTPLPPAGLPSPVTPTHGDAFFGLYLVAAPFGATELDAAVRQLGKLGVEAFPGDINCDEGAADQLDVPTDVAVVAIYFDRRRDARAWLEELDPPPLGIAMVNTFCLD